MLRKNINLIWMTTYGILLLALLLTGIILHSNNASAPFSLSINQGTHKCEISLWSEDSNTWYAFLPAYVKLENVNFEIDGKTCELDDLVVNDGLSLRDIKIGHTYKLGEKKQVIFLKSENLPTIYIETQSGSMDYLKEDKNHKEKGSFLLVDVDGTEVAFDSIPWISGRGNQTWTAEKRGWGFKLPKDTSLLGMSKHDKWVLLANAFDSSGGLRNYSAYQMAIEAGLEYSSDLRFVDLFLNKIYAGTYLLVEKIDEGTERLEIGDLDGENQKVNSSASIKRADLLRTQVENDKGKVLRTWSEINSPEDITGGYIVERNYGGKLADKPYRFTTEGNEEFVIRYPSVVSEDESDYIAHLFQKVEDILFSENNEEIKGDILSDFIDLDSWVKKYLVDEITKNEGSGSTSSYFYKKQGDEHIYAGPVWDYDKSFGTAYGNLWLDPVGLTYCELHGATTKWWKQLYQQGQAYSLITQYYADIYRPYLISLVDTELDMWAEEIAASYRMDWIRWGSILYEKLPQKLRQEVATQGDLQDSVEYLKNWILSRISFLDQVWLKNQVFYNVHIGSTSIIAVPEGKCVSEVLDLGDTVYIDSVSGQIINLSEKILEDRYLYEKIVDEDIKAEFAQTAIFTRKGYFINWLIGHKTMIVLVFTCLFMALLGGLFIYLDIKRNGNGIYRGL